MTCASYRCFVYFIHYFILVIILQWANCSLLSRFRYPYEYAAPPESTLLVEDLPDDLYENLIDERPDLEPILGPLRKTNLRHPKMPYLRKTTGSVTYYEFEFKGIDPEEEADDEEDENINNKSRNARYTYQLAELVDYNTTESSVAAGSSRMLHRTARYTYQPAKLVSAAAGFSPILYRTARYTYRPAELVDNTTKNTPGAGFSRMLPFIARNATRRSGLDPNKWWDEFPIVARCYTCGQYETGIPLNPICHDVFDSQDWRARTLARYFRTVCHYNWELRYLKPRRKVPYSWRNSYNYTSDRGLKRGIIGDFLGGCYKRYLDIGTVYTSRGCRKKWPDDGGILTGNRFLRLELLLHQKTDQCITSPHASLTPFARGISLFARYHVCVCPGRYCNKATISKAYMPFLLLSLLLIALFNVMSNLP